MNTAWTRLEEGFRRLVPRVTDPDAKDFLQRWQLARDEMFATTCFLAAVVVHVFALGLEPFMQTLPRHLLVFQVMHVAMLLATGLWFFVWFPKRKSSRHLVVFLAMILVLVFELVLRDCNLSGDCAVAAVNTCALTITLCRCSIVLLFPYHQPWRIAAGGALLLGFGFLEASPRLELFGTLGASMIGVAFCACVRLLVAAWTTGEGLREFNLRRHIAPLQIVRRSALDSRPVEEIFRPELRPCVCVSTDWRNYQSLSATLTPTALASALDEYYEMCDRLLHEVAPAGDYYSDWIADELFIVFFAPDAARVSEVAREAVLFATRLIEEKVTFLETHAHPRAIDVGVASGTALVGMMGPKGHRKATALGEVPGRARRLQTAGKKLRATEGEADRVVFGQDTRALLGDWGSVETYVLTGKDAFRDLEDREIYHLKAPARRRAA